MADKQTWEAVGEYDAVGAFRDGGLDSGGPGRRRAGRRRPCGARRRAGYDDIDPQHPPYSCVGAVDQQGSMAPALASTVAVPVGSSVISRGRPRSSSLGSGGAAASSRPSTGVGARGSAAGGRPVAAAVAAEGDGATARGSRLPPAAAATRGQQRPNHSELQVPPQASTGHTETGPPHRR
jgi:hypothetical protein